MTVSLTGFVELSVVFELELLHFGSEGVKVQLTKGGIITQLGSAGVVVQFTAQLGSVGVKVQLTLQLGSVGVNVQLTLQLRSVGVKVQLT